MRRFISVSFFLYFATVGVSSPLSSQDENGDEPRYLIPPQKAERATYDSLTEETGTLKLRKERREKAEKEAEEKSVAPEKNTQELPTINFNNVNITEVLKYASRLTGKNFVYDPQELQFTITMISDAPSTLEEVLAMIIQSLRAHGFSVIEEGGSFVIHTNPAIRGAGATPEENQGIEGPQMATRVFILQNLDAERCSALVKNMVSDGALVHAVGDSKIIVSDITENLNRIADVIKQLDAQSGGLDIGQYVAIAASPAALSAMCERLVAPMAGDKPLVLVPHPASNSVFIVSTSFLIDKAINVMRTIDLNEKRTGVLAGQKRDDKGAEGQAAGEQEEAITQEELKKRLVEQGLPEAQVNALTLEAAKEAYRKARRTIQPEESGLPLGTTEATQFLIYKLQYRKNSEVTKALKSLSESLMKASQAGGGQKAELTQSDLIITLNSLQDLDDNNTIVFTGTRASLEKVKSLVAEIDIPVRQVFIEALVIDTTLSNSLQFGVQWGGKIQRRNLGAGIGFRDPILSAFGGDLDAIQQVTPVQVSAPTAPPGLSAGYLGRKIKFLGKGFRSTGALIQALQSDSETHIIMNPKIVTEHNVPAEVFVGQQIPIKGQTIANSTIGSTSSVLATNYNTQEIGVSLKVTPLISAHENVTLIIEQKISTASAVQVNSQGKGDAPPATVNETRTVTRVHLPTDHFLVMSGLITEQHDIVSNKIPLLGSIPIIGALFSTNTDTPQKRNLMIFIRPIIIDNTNDIDEITKNQDTLLKQKSAVQQGNNQLMDTLRSLLNLN